MYFVPGREWRIRNCGLPDRLLRERLGEFSCGFLGGPDWRIRYGLRASALASLAVWAETLQGLPGPLGSVKRVAKHRTATATSSGQRRYARARNPTPAAIYDDRPLIRKFKKSTSRRVGACNYS
jgi:hypothetical protein